MKQQNQTCSICGTGLKVEKIIYTQNIGDKIYIVKDVPTQVCPECGEQYLSPNIVEAIQKLIEKGKAPETKEVPVFYLPQTA